MGCKELGKNSDDGDDDDSNDDWDKKGDFYDGMDDVMECNDKNDENFGRDDTDLKTYKNDMTWQYLGCNKWAYMRAILAGMSGARLPPDLQVGQRFR